MGGRELVRTARRLVAGGWPVVPGAWWSRREGRHRCDLNSCVTGSVHPAPIGCHEGAICAAGWADLATYALPTVDRVEVRWSYRPYTILLVTGLVADALDAPAAVAGALLEHLRMIDQPVLAAHGAGRVLVFVAAGRPVDPDRAGNWARTGVVFHQHRSWVALPPSVVDGTQVRWTHRLPRTGPLPLPDVGPLLPLVDRFCPPPPRPARGVVSMPALTLPHHGAPLARRGHQPDAHAGHRYR